MGYRGYRPWGLLAMGAQGAWGTGVWGTWVIGAQGVWGTRGMGHIGNGSHGQWGTWAMGYRGMGKWAMGPMGDLHPKCQKDVKLSKRCQVVKKMSNVKK